MIGKSLLKLALYGLAGSGKSTVARALEYALTQTGLTVQVIKLAEPLYRIQSQIYEMASKDIGKWEHDNELLRTMATQFRRINPDYLVDDFLSRAANSVADVVINDDLRDTEVDYPRLHANGFRFLCVECDDSVRQQRLKTRGDRNVVADSISTWGYDRITPDYTLDTTALAPEDVPEKIAVIIDKWVADPPR
jgi:hypothetical protein